MLSRSSKREIIVWLQNDFPARKQIKIPQRDAQKVVTVLYDRLDKPSVK